MFTILNHGKHAHNNHARSPPKAKKMGPVTKPRNKSISASESDKETDKDIAMNVKPVNFCQEKCQIYKKC